MLKYKANETLTGDIDGVNKVYTSPEFIALVDSIIVDGNLLTENDYTTDRYTLTLTVAPTTSIVFNYFFREELDIVGDGLTTFGDLIREVYEELGRNELSRVYQRDRVESMINKSIKRITNKTSEKKTVQHYALEGLNGFRISELEDDGFNGAHIQGVDIEGAMLAGDSVYIPYTNYDGTKFTTTLGVDTVLNEGDKGLVGHRIPYGVQKISQVYVDNCRLEFIDNQLFNIETKGHFTVIRGKDGNQYLFLPYSEKAYTLVVKYVPDREFLVRDTDIVDIPFEYTTTIVYDVLYRLLLSREDDRAAGYKTLLYGDRQDPGLLKEYRAFIKEQVKKTRGKVVNAPVYGFYSYKGY